MTEPLRLRISRSHPIVGEYYRLLDDHEYVQIGDETATVSTMLSLSGDSWGSVTENELGHTVGQLCGPNSEDADAHDRIYRRLTGVRSVYDPEISFMDRCLSGEVVIEDVIGFVSFWHCKQNTALPGLHEYLGMTEAEFGVWVNDDSALASIVAARQSCEGN